MKVKLTAIDVTADRKTIKLSVDDAKELYRQLHELFGDKVIHVPSPPIIIERDRYDTYPQITWTDTPATPDWNRPTITCYSTIEGVAQ